MLKTNRGLVKYILLSLITFGIYGIVVQTRISEEINQVASARDGKHTMNYCLIFFLFGWLTLGIAALVWRHRICHRIGEELAARNISYSFGATTFWGWCILGSLIFVGPFVFMHKFFKSMNLLNADYNSKLSA